MRKLTTILLSLLMAFTLCLSVSAEDNNDDDLSTQATSVAKVDDTEYATLQEAINNANGKEVVLFASTNEDIIIPENVTVTININEGVTLTNKTNHTIINKGNLTITGSGTVDNVTHAKGDIVNNYGGVVTLNGSIKLTRTKEASKDKDNSGGNSWYNISNQGTMTINDNVSVVSSGAFSSLIRNGEGKIDEEATLTINSGTFSGGINTVKNGDFGILYINDGEFLNSTQATLLNWHYAEINGGKFEPTNRAIDAVVTGIWTEPTYQTRGKTIITGGEFEGLISLYDSERYPGEAFPGENNISGGTFLTDVSQYLEMTYKLANINNKFVVVQEGENAQVTEKVTPAVDRLVFETVKSDPNNNAVTSIVLKSEEKALNDEEKAAVDNEIKNNTSLKDKNVEYLPLDLKLIPYIGNEEKDPITHLNEEITVTLYLDDATVAKLKDKTVKIVRIHYNDDNTREVKVLDIQWDGNALLFKTDRFSNYTIVYEALPTTPTTPSTDSNKSYDPKDKNHDGIISCDEEMNSANWVWSENKKACVYKVTNTSAR